MQKQPRAAAARARFRLPPPHSPTAPGAPAASLTARLERVLEGTAGSCGGRAPPRPHRGRHVTAAKSRGKVTASPAPGLARPRHSDPVPPAPLRETFRSELARVAGAANLLPRRHAAPLRGKAEPRTANPGDREGLSAPDAVPRRHRGTAPTRAPSVSGRDSQGSPRKQ